MWREKGSILNPDERFANIVRGDPATGTFRFVTIDDMYDDMAVFEFSPSAPEEIVRQFNLARSAYIYSWFDYEMVTLAEEHVYTVIEMALRRRAKDENSGLSEKATMKPALDHARARGWLKDDDFGYLNTGQQVPMLDMLVFMRNDLMHGKTHLYPNGSLTVMEMCFDIIVKLFPPSP